MEKKITVQSIACPSFYLMVLTELIDYNVRDITYDLCLELIINKVKIDRKLTLFQLDFHKYKLVHRFCFVLILFSVPWIFYFITRLLDLDRTPSTNLILTLIKMISLDFHIKWVYWFVLPKKTCICFWMVRTSVWILQWQKFQFTRWSTKNLCTTNILIIRYYSVVLFFQDSRIDKIFTSLNFVIIVKLVYYTSLEFNLHESSYLEFVWIMYYSVRRKL